VGFGGMGVGGIGPNRKMWSANVMPGTDHLPATLNIAEAAFSKGQPQWGAHLADELERLVALHDASNIAAVIVEPLAGSAGVLIPPVGYLETARDHQQARHPADLRRGHHRFGRLGAATGAERLKVTPDLITMAKAINNAAVPMGAVACAAKCTTP
jgi:beta-alanine--pyruvate transaminase